MTRSVAFCGYYGQANFGDDIFSVAIDRAIAQTGLPIRPAFVAPYPSEAGIRLYGARRLRLARSLTPRPAGMIAAAVLTEASVRHAGLVFGGGSLFGSERYQSRDALVSLATALRRPLGAIGVSAGPFSSTANQRRIGRIIGRLRFVVVRDAQSADVLAQIAPATKVIYGADLAATLGAVPELSRAQDPDSGVLGLALCAPGGHAGHKDILIDEQLTLVRAVSVSALSSGRSLRLLALNSGGRNSDVALVERAATLARQIGVKVETFVHTPESTLDTWRAIVACSHIVAVRMHAAIAALVSGVPFALYEYHAKLTAFANEVRHDRLLRLPVGSVDMDSALRTVGALLEQRTVQSAEREAYCRRSWLAFKPHLWQEYLR